MSGERQCDHAEPDALLAGTLAAMSLYIPTADATTTFDTIRSFVGGDFVSTTSGERFETRHPGNDRVIAEVVQASDADVDRAVKIARTAFTTWSRTPALERSRILHRAVTLIREHNGDLARLDTLDAGRPLAETSTEDVVTGADVIEFYAGVIPTIGGDTLSFPAADGPGGFARMVREPVGVCVGIGAWNYPIQIAMWKSALALACGNTMIFKPAELTPISATYLAQIYQEAGLPDGVFNVVQGDARVGQALVAHPGVDKVSLTGEVSTGRAVLAGAAATLKAVTLELGGKSPIVVFDDADLDGALNAAMTNNFYSTGQVCSNGTRVFVQRGAYDEFVTPIADRVAAIRVGDPFEPDTQMGPLVSAEHRDKVLGYFRAARRSSARELGPGGETPSDPALADGYYVLPAAFVDCTDDMPFVTDEVFGPLMSVLPFDNEDEAIARANGTEFGLSGAVFSADFSRANRVAAQIEAGSVWINDYGTLPASVPFGGVKQSGFGRENGLASIEHYTRVKMIYSNLGAVERYL